MADKKQKKEKKVYRDGLSDITNPSQTTFGKFLIWVLAILMAGGTLFTLIFTIIEMANR